MAQRYVGVLVVAGVALLIGLGLLASSAATRVQTTTFTIPAGPGYCAYRSFDVVTSGIVTITYTASPGIVEQYVMTAAEHQAYQAGSGMTYIGEDHGSANTFTTSLPTGGTYYVLSCHGTGYDSTLQAGQHTLAITGLDPGPFYGAIVAIGIAVLLILVALRLRSKDLHARRATEVWAAGEPPFESSSAYPQVAPYPTAAPVASGTLLRTLHVRLENASAVSDSLQILLNGTPLATVPLDAGKTAEMDLHPNVSPPFGGTLHLEVVSRAGSRAAQDVVPDAAGRAEVALRLG